MAIEIVDFPSYKMVILKMAIEIVDFPSYKMMMFNSYVTNYQRVPWWKEKIDVDLLEAKEKSKKTLDNFHINSRIWICQIKEPQKELRATFRSSIPPVVDFQEL